MRGALGAIAQLVEQRTENPCVPSSILGGTTRAGYNKPALDYYENIGTYLAPSVFHFHNFASFVISRGLIANSL